MSDPYDHKSIESKWQERWPKDRLYETPDKVKGKENFYTLVEFPYPSGDLHVGHWYAFTVPDIFARYKRMQGKNVLYPIGFDAFGLPAENAAIKNKVDPAEWTWKNIDRMRGQLRSMGTMFDWSREVVTCDPAYYKWTQWLFLKMYEKNLAYRGKALVNWDPVDKTVLANEQVLPDGTAERSGAKVEKKELEQWFLKITDYADRLLSDLHALDWPEPIKESQRNWIGKSEGAEIDFSINDESGHPMSTVTVFTTRPDTLFGATFLVLAPEHPILETLAGTIVNWSSVEEYVAKAKAKSEIDRSGAKEKTGVELKGIKAINPATKEEIPIFVADYVLGGYGTGAIMAVPAHDDRDLQFALNFIGISAVRPVIAQVGSVAEIKNNPSLTAAKIASITGAGFAHLGNGVLFNSGEFDGMQNEEAKEKITKAIGGRMKTTYKLRDWLISRQRYWGAPIPIVYDPEGKPHPIPEKHLPWLLPTDVDFTPTGEAPLARSKELKGRTEKIFGKGWRSEVDTMDTFVDSSWYFLRYLDSKNEKEFSSLSKQKTWMPVGRYSGGAEHTTMHLLYSRFYYKVLFDLGLATEPEPYKVRMNRGIILAEDGRKMSKRWGNVVNPDEQVANVGADAVRMYLAFIGPYNEVGSFPWSTNGLVGVRRFLERAWALATKVEPLFPKVQPLETLLHQTIQKVSENIENMKFNTAVSALMIFVNTAEKGGAGKLQFESFLKLLAPFAPHMTEELWERLGHTRSIHLEPWPAYDSAKAVSETVTVAIQIGGKTRGVVSVPRGAGEEEVLAEARKDDKILKYLYFEPKKVIFVQDRILNLVP